MIAALRALRTVLEGNPKLRVHIGDATGTLPPFVVLWSPQMGDDRDAGTGACDSWSAQLGVTFTADNTERAMEMADAGLALLTPGKRPKLHQMAGRALWLRFVELRATDVHRSLTLPLPDSHPASVVALFDLHSQPTEA